LAHHSCTVGADEGNGALGVRTMGVMSYYDEIVRWWLSDHDHADGGISNAIYERIKNHPLVLAHEADANMKAEIAHLLSDDADIPF